MIADLNRERFIGPAIAGVGAMGCIVLLAELSRYGLMGMWLMAPFGASMVIVFALPESPLAQPRNVILGHLIAASIGLGVATLFGVSSWSLGAAVGLAVAAMMLTGTIHPPAGANPLLVMMTGEHWGFLLNPVLAGVLMIVGFAWFYHTRIARRAYPQRWF